jgi:hypothetical protein
VVESVMMVEWLNGPVDGSVFEVEEGARTVRICFLKPYTIRQALEDGWLPTTQEMVLPIEIRHGKLYVTYPTNEKRAAFE